MATVDPFEEQIRNAALQLTRRAMNLYRLRAALWALGLVLVATVGFVGLDYTLHVEELGWRWLWSILWLATLAGIAWRWLPDATSFRLTPIQVAQWIERRRPELGDSLSRLLAIGDLPESDTRYGSVEFRRAAVSGCDKCLSDLPWQSFLDKQPTLGAGLFCIVSLLTVSGLALSSSSIVTQGLARIALPWSWAPWPRSEQLQLVNAPDMIARDSELEIRVVDLNLPMPPHVELEVRMDSVGQGQPSSLRMPMRVVQELAVVTLPAMESDFSIRPIGGDQQDGPWHAIRVTRQPQLKEYAFAVQPPAYTKQSPTELVGQRIDVLSGSRVSLRGKFDEPLKWLCAKPVNDPKPKDQATPKVSAANEVSFARLSADGQEFELFTTSGEPWLIEEDRRWQFEMETIDGLQLTDTRQWTIHVTSDRTPAITMAPIEPRGITRNATLNIVGSASDDLGLVEIDLSWHVANQAAQSIRLWPSDAESTSENSPTTERRSVDVSTAWSVSLASLSVGQALTVELVARDTAGQVGKSVPQTLEVLDEAAALAILQRTQAETFGPLRQLLDAQRRNQQSLNRTVEVARQLDKIGREQADAVASAHQLGQSIAGGLARNQDSLARQLEQLASQLHRNQLVETPLAKDVARLRSQIEDLVKQNMAPALKEIEAAHQALRSLENDANPSSAINQLSKAAQANQLATDQLASLVESVAAAESLSDVQKQIQDLASDQATAANGTERLQVDAVLRGGSAQLEATRAGIQSDQLNLARRAEELATRLAQESKPTASTEKTATDKGPGIDPASQKLLENAHRKLLERRIGDEMRQAAEMVKENHLSDALAAQRRAQHLLDEVAAELGGRSSIGLESSSQSMQDLAVELDKLANNQRQTAEELSHAATTANSSAQSELTGRQKTLRDDIHELADEPSMQANQNLQQLLDQATQAADQAIEQAEKSKFKEAAQEASQAAEALKSAAQTAQQKAEQLKSQVAQQQMFDLRTLLSAAVKRQQPVVTTLETVDQAEPTNATDLLSTEKQLQQQLADGRQRLQSLDAFDWLLGQCDEELLRTIASLERQRTGRETLASAKAALDMMMAAQAAVTEDAPPDNPPVPSDASANPSASPGPQASQLPTLASLRLLRQMQTLINEQSDQLLSGANETDNSALTRMADRQQALAVQVARLREQLKQRQ